MTNDESRLIQTLKNGGIAVVRTDTVYGVIACADDEMAVERVYSAKQRDPSKQCIVLLASSNDAPAYNKIIEIALKNDMTYALGIGAITNIALAIKKEPKKVRFIHKNTGL